MKPEQLLVLYRCDGCGVDSHHTRPATDDEVKAYAATLDGAKQVLITHGGGSRWSDPYPAFPQPGRYLVNPLPDKETT